MKNDLTQGSVTKTMLRFAFPMIAGNLLQQCYNIADTLIVGRYIGVDALAAVGSTYTLMTFITSILIGLCMGSGAVFSCCIGAKDDKKLKDSISTAFFLIGGVTLVINAIVIVFTDPILHLLQSPADIYGIMRDYVQVIFLGLIFVFLYNYFSFLLRAQGNSFIPLCFLAAAAFLNIGLDLLFVAVLHWGIRGAAFATILAQAVSGVGLGLYTWVKEPSLRPHWIRLGKQSDTFQQILHFSTASCIQQSVMNFGILMIQGLVNSFGTAVMAAFAAAVKIDSIAYMPAQEFANAYSLFISQNHGAGDRDRVRRGTKSAVVVSLCFCLIISIFVALAAPWLMQFFIDADKVDIIAIGVSYLRIEGVFYCGIGLLFLLYGYYRGIGIPSMSLVLTVISLGTRVLLAYVLSPIPAIGVTGIWCSIPIGWVLADIFGVAYMYILSRRQAKQPV